MGKASGTLWLNSFSLCVKSLLRWEDKRFRTRRGLWDWGSSQALLWMATATLNAWMIHTAFWDVLPDFGRSLPPPETHTHTHTKKTPNSWLTVFRLVKSSRNLELTSIKSQPRKYAVFLSVLCIRFLWEQPFSILWKVGVPHCISLVPKSKDHYCPLIVFLYKKDRTESLKLMGSILLNNIFLVLFIPK